MAEQDTNATITPSEQQPTGIFGHLEQEFDGVLRRMRAMVSRRAAAPTPAADGDTVSAPTTDAAEPDRALVIKAELPGIKKNDVSITVVAGYLTIEAHREAEHETQDARYYAYERFAGSMRRSFALPEGLDPNTISARFKDGQLEIHVPVPADGGSKPVAITIED